MQVKAEKKTIDYTLVAAANAAADSGYEAPLWIMAMPPERYPIAYFARVKTAFAGGTKPEVKVGRYPATDDIIKSQRIDAVGDLVHGFGGPGLCAHLHPDIQPDATAQADIRATFTDTGTMANLSAGSIEFVVVYAE